MANDESQIRTRRGVCLPEAELELTATRSGGPGGQNVNKTSTAVQLRFDIKGSNALSDEQKQRLLAMDDQRLTTEGEIVIRAQEFRSQRKNREAAIGRLIDFIDTALEPVRPRRKTRPGKAAAEKRLREKAARSKVKAMRRPPGES